MFNKILLVFICVLFTTFTYAQDAPRGWHLLDLEKDSVFGISLEKVYTSAIKKKKPKKIIVAVIDGGVDTGHEDLKEIIYTNQKEKPGNGKDDDRNGYIDDIHGWNFLGSSAGNIVMDNMDLIRLLRIELKKDPDSEESARLQGEINSRLGPLIKARKATDEKLNLLNTVTSRIRKEFPTAEDFRSYVYQNHPEEQLLVELINADKAGTDYKSFRGEIEAKNKKYRENIDYQLNINYDPRINPEFQNRFYGNPDSKGPDPFHGTHAAGIIAAVRNNYIGIQGIADHVTVMPVRVVTHGGDVRDEDMAAAIRYAADNGAKVINMSFGKTTSVNKAIVDDAVKYAMKKDILIVHGAGNNGYSLDDVKFYPDKEYASGEKAEACIDVGASNVKDDKNLLAWFSNYSKTKVDICAPGVAIFSTWPDNKYESINGTSMAAPIVSGVAALLRSYYPKLSAVQIKEIIMRSVNKVDHPVIIDRTGQEVPFSEICVSGGIINAYKAFQLAEKY